MTHNDWVRTQFRRFKIRYRDVLLITSFIETIIRDKASCTACRRREDFEKSLKLLRRNSQYKNDCLKQIDKLRTDRNKLLHDIIREQLAHKVIDDTIREMAENIRQICTGSNLIQNYFNENYKFDPAKFFKQVG
jgi:septal ring factor EnvC (AmiA/AmiB activator)